MKCTEDTVKELAKLLKDALNSYDRVHMITSNKLTRGLIEKRDEARERLSKVYKLIDISYQDYTSLFANHENLKKQHEEYVKQLKLNYHATLKKKNQSLVAKKEIIKARNKKIDALELKLKQMKMAGE